MYKLTVCVLTFSTQGFVALMLVFDSPRMFLPT